MSLSSIHQLLIMSGLSKVPLRQDWGCDAALYVSRTMRTGPRSYGPTDIRWHCATSRYTSLIGQSKRQPGGTGASKTSFGPYDNEDPPMQSVHPNRLGHLPELIRVFE